MSELAPKEATEQKPEGEGIAVSEIRNHEFFKKILGEKDSKLKEVLSELESMKSKAEEEARQKELLKKEEEGKYEEIKSSLMAENETLRKKYETEMTQLKLENALARSGADEYFTTWAIHNYSGGDIGEYIDGLKKDEKHSARFNLNQVPVDPLNPEPSATVPASRGPNNWTQIKAELKSGDPVKARNAGKAIQEYYLREGKLPPG